VFREGEAESHAVQRRQAADGHMERVFGRDADDASDERFGRESAAALTEILALAPEIRLKLILLRERGSSEQGQRHDDD
jgi:hypothetical protein